MCTPALHLASLPSRPSCRKEWERVNGKWKIRLKLVGHNRHYSYLSCLINGCMEVLKGFCKCLVSGAASSTLITFSRAWPWALLNIYSKAH